MKKLILALAMAAAFGVIEPAAGAQPYPIRPITMIVPFAAGGPTDVIARIIAERMRLSLGQTVVVENVTGAAGSIGVGRAAHAAADGYTLSIGHYGTHAVNSLIYHLDYDVLKDFEPVGLVATNPYLILSNNAVPATDLKGLIAWFKKNPNKASIPTDGVGSSGHLIGLLFQQATGVRFTFVPYRGGSGPAMQDLLAGHIDAKFEQVALALPLLKAGQVRAYAVTSDRRLATLPEIPTADEAGLPGFHVSAWHGLWVPKGTPKDIVARLNAAVEEALDDPAVRASLVKLGQQIPDRGQRTPETLHALQQEEIDKWAPIVKAEHIAIK